MTLPFRGWGYKQRQLEMRPGRKGHKDFLKENKIHFITANAKSYYNRSPCLKKNSCPFCLCVFVAKHIFYLSQHVSIFAPAA